MKLIKQGAEAKLYLDKNILIKERIKKNYRIEEIDLEKRKYPTRRESNLIERASKININVPKIIKTDEKLMKIEMEYIKGETLKDYWSKVNNKILESIGEQISRLHDNSIIHGDLTTSNMIVKEGKVYFIDFGLGFISNKIEDKAVDLHLLKQALESKHHENWEESFNEILKGYNKSKNFKEVMNRLDKVERRGRYKLKI